MFSNWGTGPQFMKKKMMNWLNHGILWFPIVAQHHLLFPIGSMYGIYANIWGILMVNVTIYSIHGSYGFLFNTFGSCESPWSLELLTVLLEVVMSTKCTCERTWKNKGTHVIKFTCSTLSKICKKTSHLLAMYVHLLNVMESKRIRHGPATVQQTTYCWWYHNST